MSNFTIDRIKSKRYNFYGMESTHSDQNESEESCFRSPNYGVVFREDDKYIVENQYLVNKPLNHDRHSAMVRVTFIKNPKVDSRKEELYINAIKNLTKKAKYLNLSLELAEGLITEQDFEDEINENQDSFVITVSPLKNHYDLHLISEIIKKIGGEFSEDDVEDLFGISLNNNR